MYWQGKYDCNIIKLCSSYHLHWIKQLHVVHHRKFVYTTSISDSSTSLSSDIISEESSRQSSAVWEFSKLVVATKFCLGCCTSFPNVFCSEFVVALLCESSWSELVCCVCEDLWLGWAVRGGCEEGLEVEWSLFVWCDLVACLLS